MTLSEGHIGCSYRIHRIELEEQVTRRLEMLGMTQGTDVQVLNKKRSGPMIIKVRGTRFALGHVFACGIYLEEGSHE